MMMNIEYIVKFCDELCIERFYRKHLKSGTHITNICEKPQKKYK